jgi:uncharacterized cupin superfamily protein
MTRLPAGAVTDAASLEIPLAPVPTAQVVAGAPRTGYVELESADGTELGVWEMTAGAMRDVEADEVFVVLAGTATVEFDDPAREPVDLRPGSVVRLAAGMRTVWTVHTPLRKLYLSP